MRMSGLKLNANRKASTWLMLQGAVLVLTGLLLGSEAWAKNDPGVTDTTIRIGSTQPLEGDFHAYGQGMKIGMEAALKGTHIQNRTVEFAVVNDFYTPAETVKGAKQLIQQGLFLMLGSFGTPTTQAVLPILAENKVPAVGFYTGAGYTGPGDVLNFRATYAHEVASAVEAALTAGVKPDEVCVYAQNDAYGMAGVRGVRTALAKQAGAAEIVAKIDQITALPEPNPQRNGIGPVGTYERDTLNARDGYDSLKKWEKTTNKKCRFVATVGTHKPTAQFIGYARYRDEKWVYSVPSPAGGENLLAALKEFKVTDKIIATQVVPALDSPFPVVVDARKALGDNLNYISLEGYIVGKMFLAIMNNVKGEISRENFLKSAHSQIFDLGGLKVNFANSNQGSDYVLLTYLNGGVFEPATPRNLEAMFQR